MVGGNEELITLTERRNILPSVRWALQKQNSGWQIVTNERKKNKSVSLAYSKERELLHGYVVRV
jgi:hypothetical protein